MITVRRFVEILMFVLSDERHDIPWKSGHFDFEDLYSTVSKRFMILFIICNYGLV